MLHIEYIHSYHFVHGDIKPANFLMGTGDHKSQVYIINFSLTKKYRDPKTHLHITCRTGCSLIGTTPYASINNHLGVEPSHCDDLESLAYILLHFLCGSLPWHSTGPTFTKQWCNTILKKKMILPKVLFCSFPEEFSIFLNYSHALCFDEKPDYAYICRLFCDLFVCERYQYGHLFAECTIPNDQSTVVQAENNSRQRVLQSSMDTTSDRVFVPSSLSLKI